MKKQIVRLIALLIFASVAMSSCSVEYREHHRHHWDDEHHEHDHDRDHDHMMKTSVIINLKQKL